MFIGYASFKAALMIFGWEWNSCRVGISPTSPFRSVAFTSPLSRGIELVHFTAIACQ